jgi:hypothetical protein
VTLTLSFDSRAISEEHATQYLASVKAVLDGSFFSRS